MRRHDPGTTINVLRRVAKSFEAAHALFSWGLPAFIGHRPLPDIPVAVSYIAVLVSTGLIYSVLSQHPRFAGCASFCYCLLVWYVGWQQDDVLIRGMYSAFGLTALVLSVELWRNAQCRSQ